MRVVGCDPSTKRCALADNTGKTGSILLYSKEENGRRLHLSYRQIRIFTQQFCFPKPDCVLVEQASGVSRNPSLVEMVGVTRAAIYGALEVPVFTVPSGRWKKALTGDGSIDKPGYCQWLKDAGYSFSNDDEAAALGIALAGQKLASIKPA